MNIDLTKYVIAGASWGPWLQDKDAFTASELRLGDPLDGVTLAGPLRVRVSVQARNHFAHVGASAAALQVRDVYSYMLDIPPGQTWTYPAPRALGVGVAPVATAPPTLSTASASIGTAMAAASPRGELLWGANAGFGVAIRPAGADLCADPCGPVDPCAPKSRDCNCGGRCGRDCGCGCHHAPTDLPCDFATGKGSHAGTFFPAACEPCEPGAFVGMPPVKGPSLLVPAARGGTVRTRYFNGMFITREDLSTDQNNNRIKHSLMNRAMGQGVVWGLNVGLENNAICVWPGYGVDCCGNDIVISAPYRVDADALVRDPAAAARIAAGRQQRMNLLLEYFECPEEPRPVHGDPCALDSISCEMSRIRETARLRLIPPCDVDDSGPIKDFLEEMRKLRGDPIVGPMLGHAHGAPAPAPAVPLQVPFTVLVEGLDAAGVVGSVRLTPKMGSEPSPLVSGDAKGVPARSMMTRARITIASKSGFQLTSGDVVKQSPAGTVTPVRTPTSISWEDDLPQPGNPPPINYFFANWTFQTTGGSLVSNGTAIKLAVLPEAGLRMKLHVDVEPSNVEGGVRPSPFPCSVEACDPAGRPRFPVPIPWLHEDPGKPGEAADPKVIVLAILYAVVVSRMARNGAATSAEAQAEMQKLANALNVAAWKLFYGDLPSDSRADLMEALRRLFQAWCKALLYPGPKCECGYDPHGVVIGCAVVQGGRITMVDPWGGRRWVVHYPLIAYWGKQFGIQPFDAIASKFFDLICCISQLTPARDTVVLTGAASPLSAVPATAVPVVPIGASALFLDQPANIPARLAELGVTVDRTVAVGPVEFISHVVRALNLPLEPRVTTRAVLYTVAGLPELNFIAPDPEAPLSPAPPGAQPPPAPASPGTTPPPAPTPAAPARLATIVRSAVTARPARTAVPLLLREMTETMTRDLLHAIAPEPATDEGRQVRDALAGAGISSVAALLDAHPEDLQVDVLNRRNAEGLADLLEVSEKAVAATTRAVGNTVVKFSSARRLMSRHDLRQPDVAADFTTALVAALKEAVSPEYAAAAVARAAGPLPS